MHTHLLSQKIECDNEQIMDIKNKCDYMLLAENEIKTGRYNKSEKIKIWETAAENYSDAGDYIMEEKCLLKAVGTVCDSENKKTCDNENVMFYDDKAYVNIYQNICSKENISRDYYQYLELTKKLIDVKIKNKDYKFAIYYIEQYYKLNKKSFDKKISEDKINLKRILEYLNVIRQTAEYYVKAGDDINSLRMYLAAMYIAIKCLNNEEEKDITEEIKKIKVGEDIGLSERRYLVKDYSEKILLSDNRKNNIIPEDEDEENTRTRGKIKDLLILLKEDITVIADKSETRKDICEKEKEVDGKDTDINNDEKEMCRKLIEKISEDYEYGEIEFKR